MFKLFGGLGFIFVVMIGMSAMFESGTSGFVVAAADAAVDDSDSIIPVDDATGFEDPPGTSQRVIWLEKEAILYQDIELTVDANCAPFDAPCFTGITRGALGTEANDHANNSFIYNEAAGTLNSLGAYNIARQDENVGSVEGVILTPNGLKNAAAQLGRFDGAYFTGNMAFIKLTLIATLTLGLIATLVFAFVGTIRGIFTG